MSQGARAALKSENNKRTPNLCNLAERAFCSLPVFMNQMSV